jgi:hypothetical protein
VLRRKGVRTIILRDYDGIMEVNHPGGNQWDGRRGERDLVQWVLASHIYTVTQGGAITQLSANF